MRLRVLHNLDNSNRGGIPEYLLRLHHYSPNQHEFWAADGSMAEEMRGQGMLLWNGGPPHGGEPYQVVLGHTVGGWSGLALANWAHERGAKFVEVMHSVYASPTPPACCDGFIAMSDLALAANRHMPNGVRLYPPVEVSQFKTEHGPAIGRLSRLVDEKRPQDFVEIARHFDHEAFLLAGDGQLFESLRAESPANLYMPGWMRDFPDFYGRLKVFVFPTRDECCCVSVAMAQGAGLPVICQDIPALRETTGGHAVYANGLPDFCAKLQAYLNDPSAFASMASLGREWAFAQFDTSVTVPALDAYLEAVWSKS